MQGIVDEGKSSLRKYLVRVDLSQTDNKCREVKSQWIEKSLRRMVVWQLILFYLFLFIIIVFMKFSGLFGILLRFEPRSHRLRRKTLVSLQIIEIFYLLHLILQI